MKNSNIFWLMFIAATIFSCKQSNTATKQLIMGSWVLEEATRNGRPAESLASLYFEFLPDGAVKTNFNSLPEEGNYEIKGDKVLLRNISRDSELKVESITAENLVLTTELTAGNGANYAFRFVMRKSNGEEETTQPKEEQMQ
ncbi:MAG: hypothetical protein SFU99_12085 [Saprospiraceae bacterium]|nr:hypothetical protein [Saprospiraceae bacterium]